MTLNIGSIKMTEINVTMMCLPDFYLRMMKDQQDAEGREARKEIRRRKMVGFYIECQEEKAEFIAEQEELARKKALQEETVDEKEIN
mgnify:CR=1 FL=1